MLKTICTTCALVMSALAATQASAGQSSGILQVSIEVVDTCEAQAAPLTFVMARDSSFGAAAETNVALRCTPNTEYSVSLDDGANAEGGRRQLLNPATGQTIVYDVYLDASRGQRWGARQSELMAGNAGEDGMETITVYGFVPASSIKPDAGHFSDSLVMTVHF